MKLLLILMWADKMGRKPEDTIQSAIAKNANSLFASIQKSQKRLRNIENQTKPFEGGPEEFAHGIIPGFRGLEVGRMTRAGGLDAKKTPIDFARMCEAAGGYGELVTENKDVGAALKRGLENTRKGVPAVVGVRLPSLG